MKTEVIQVREHLFKEIYSATFPKLYKIFLKSLKSEDLTNDVLQDTYLKLWSKLDDLDGRQDYMPFLFFYARNFARKEIALRLNKELNPDALALHSSNDMESELEIKEFRSILGQVIESLPPKRKLVYRMFKEEGLSYKRIAEVLNISNKTVDNHLSEAYKAVKKSLASNYGLKNTILVYIASYLSVIINDSF